MKKTATKNKKSEKFFLLFWGKIGYNCIIPSKHKEILPYVQMEKFFGFYKRGIIKAGG